MGFLFDEPAKPVSTPKKSGRKKDEILLAQGCDNCTLKPLWPTISTPCMKLTRESADVDLMIIGEAPGEEEDRQGAQFVGKSGKSVRALIPRRELSRIAWQNTIRCRPPENREPTLSESFACSGFLDEDILAVRPRAILGLGTAPLRRFFGPREKAVSVNEVHGLKFPIEIGDFVTWFYPTFHPAYTFHMQAADPVYRTNVKTFFKQCDDWGEPKVTKFATSDVQHPKNEEELRKLLGRMRDPVAIDIETTRLRPYEQGARILTAAVSDGVLTAAFPIRWKSEAGFWNVLKEVVTTRQWIAHNAAMELSWFWSEIGWDWFPDNYFDTMALGRIKHQRSAALSLEDMSRLHLGTNVKALSNLDVKDLEAFALTDVLNYNGLDAAATAKLFRKLDPTLTPTERSNVDRLYASVRSTTVMELRGIPYDIQETNRLAADLERQQAEAQATIMNAPEVRAYQATQQKRFEIGSPIQLGEIVKSIPGAFEFLKLTKTGRVKTDETVLESIAHLSRLPEAILDEREVAKQLSTYVLPIKNGRLVYPDGLLHPSYTVMFTHTGRTSSEDPNIQNFPKRKHREIRRQIIPPKGYVLAAIDFGQLEARTFAMACRDRRFCEAIIHKMDVHKRWLTRGMEIYQNVVRGDYLHDIVIPKFKCTEEKAFKTGRDLFKGAFVFASLYGARESTCAKQTGMPLRVIEELTSELWQEYPDAKLWIDGQRRMYQDTGSVTLLTGMVRHGIMSGNEPINTPIQGTSTGHLVLEVQNALSTKALKEKDWCFHPRINVHDDLTFFLPDHEPTMIEYLDVITTEMVKIRFDWQIVPLAVEVSVGANWADLEDIGTILGDYVR